jgi:hypothetical protein
MIRLGENPWVGYGENYRMLENLINTHMEKGLFTLSKVVDVDLTTIWR